MIDPDTKRLSRLVALLTLLQTKRLVTASELARRFAVSTRTIYRDIQALENAGVPIVTQEGKGYMLLEGYRLPPLMLTESEANALVTAQQLIHANAEASLVREYEQAIHKIKAVLRYATRDNANLLASRIKCYPNPSPEHTSNYLSVLQSALTHYQRVHVHYQSAENQFTTRIVEPFALLGTQGNWLLVGWCHLRKAYRLFRLDRMVGLTVSQETFQPHPLSLQQYFERYGQ